MTWVPGGREGCLGLHCKGCVEGQALGKSRAGFEVPTWGWNHGLGSRQHTSFCWLFLCLKRDCRSSDKASDLTDVEAEAGSPGSREMLGAGSW